MVEKLVEIGYLFEFYGKLLTDKQHDAIELYYIEDLSLQEIGDTMDVTRQGIFDLIKRAEQNLYSYEEKLGLISRYFSNNEKIKEIMEVSEETLENIDFKDDKNKETIDRLNFIKDTTKEMLKDIDS